MKTYQLGSKVTSSLSSQMTLYSQLLSLFQRKIEPLALFLDISYDCIKFIKLLDEVYVNNPSYQFSMFKLFLLSFLELYRVWAWYL